MSRLKDSSGSPLNSHSSITLVTSSVLFATWFVIISVPLVRSQQSSYTDYSPSLPYNYNLEQQNTESNYQQSNNNNADFGSSGGFGSDNKETTAGDQPSFSKLLSDNFGNNNQNEASSPAGVAGGLASSSGLLGTSFKTPAGSHYDGTKKIATAASQVVPQYAPVQEKSDVQYSPQYNAESSGPSYYGYDTNVDYEPVVENNNGLQNNNIQYDSQHHGAQGNVEHSETDFKVPEIPEFHAPFPIGHHHTIHDYENPFKKGHDKDHGFSFLKHGKLHEIGKKDLILGIGIFIFFYL